MWNRFFAERVQALLPAKFFIGVVYEIGTYSARRKRMEQIESFYRLDGCGIVRKGTGRSETSRNHIEKRRLRF